MTNELADLNKVKARSKKKVKVKWDDRQHSYDGSKHVFLLSDSV